MIDEYSNETLEEFGFKKTTVDKLTFKNIIADAINQCRRNRRYIELFQASVLGLEDIIYFNIPGYQLKTEIDKIKQMLNDEHNNKIMSERNRLGRNFNKRSERAKIRIKQHEWYWNTYFKHLMQLLADKNLLLETTKYIPVRTKQAVYDTEDVLHE